MISEIARLAGTLFLISKQAKINRHMDKIFSLMEMLRALVTHEGPFP
jgi:hypothetical protein